MKKRRQGDASLKMCVRKTTPETPRRVGYQMQTVLVAWTPEKLLLY